MAEEVGETSPYAMQHLLDRARWDCDGWDCDGVRDELRASVQETLASPNAVLVIDETGFPKKGSKSVGVEPAIQRYGWAHRKLPDRRLSRLSRVQVDTL